ncbi:MAG: hypothetical protein LBQ31_02280 [Bacteroidales bacterium]|jgi:hypothetical protein|nr:hypothetical protein [Bacteroidales bacterium]
MNTKRRPVFGLNHYHANKITTFAKMSLMMKTTKKNNKPSDKILLVSETAMLKRRIEELQYQLQLADMKALAYSTMIDIAEKKFDIDIRKERDTKPSCDTSSF